MRIIVLTVCFILFALTSEARTTSDVSVTKQWIAVAAAISLEKNKKPKVVVGYGTGTTRSFAEYTAYKECFSHGGGDSCKVRGELTRNKGCLYVGAGTSHTSIGWVWGSSVDEVFFNCSFNFQFTWCSPPVGSCIH